MSDAAPVEAISNMNCIEFLGRIVSGGSIDNTCELFQLFQKVHPRLNEGTPCTIVCITQAQIFQEEM